MDNRRNYYRILHVQPDAPTEIIRSSYRTLMTKLRRHPDLGGDHWTATVINEAWSVLGDPVRRAAYDEAWKSIANPRPAPGQNPHPHPHPDSAPAPDTCLFCGRAHGISGRIPATASCPTCNTPLAPVSRERLERGQRSVSRVPRRLALTWYPGWPGKGQPGESRDLSLYGLRFMTQAAVPPGKLLKLECEGLSALLRVVAVGESDEREWRWQLRGEYLTARFRRSRGAFVSSRA